MKFDNILKITPYSLNKYEKSEILTKYLKELTEYHKEHCKSYRQILRVLNMQKEHISHYEDLPFLPVRLFKEMDLYSVPEKEIVKTMTSSGTTGSSVSKIYLNKDTSINQQKALVKIVTDFTGKNRMPMLIIDTPAVIKDRKMFSARGAGILGFSIMASERKYALNENMQLDLEGVREFIIKHKGKRIMLFGFTSMIWEYFYNELVRNQENIDLSNAVLIHGGGWKKLINESVEPQKFKACLNQVCGLREVYDYYGMVEQTGCIYMQCEYGHLHASIFSDIIIRRMEDFSVAGIGERGVIQVVSLLPESYPGHSILTEDLGVVLGEDNCPCGRKGKYFEIFGRIKNAEIRGCSDAYIAK